MKKTPFQIFLQKQKHRTNKQGRSQVNVTESCRRQTMTSDNNKALSHRLFTNFEQEIGGLNIYRSIDKEGTRTFRIQGAKSFNGGRVLRRGSPSKDKDKQFTQCERVYPKTNKKMNTKSLYEKLIQFKNMDSRYPKFIIKEAIWEKCKKQNQQKCDKAEPTDRPLSITLEHLALPIDSSVLDADYHKLTTMYECKYSPKLRSRLQKQMTLSNSPWKLQPLSPWEQQS